MENLITIELFGQTYTFRTESDMEEAKVIADSVVKEVNRIQEQGVGRQSSEMAKITIVILAALNLANENYNLKMDQTEMISQLTDRSKSLLNRIEEGMNLKE